MNALGRMECAAHAQPKSILDTLAEHERRHLPAHLRDNPVPPRSTAEYGPFLEDASDGPPQPTQRHAADREPCNDVPGESAGTHPG